MLVWRKSTMTSTRRSANNARVEFSSGDAVDQTRGGRRKVGQSKRRNVQRQGIFGWCSRTIEMVELIEFRWSCLVDGREVGPSSGNQGLVEALRSRLMLGGGAVKGAILACRRIQGFCCCYSAVLIHTGHPKALKALKAPKAHNLLRSRYSSPQGVDVMPRKGGPGAKLESRVVIRVWSGATQLSQFSCLTASIRLAGPVTRSESTLLLLP